MIVSNWHELVGQAQSLDSLQERLKQQAEVYPASVNIADDRLLFLAKDAQGTHLVVVSTGERTDGFQGDTARVGAFMVKRASLNSRNAKALRSLLPWTAPQAFGTSGISMGLGDRLGLASPGHLTALSGTGVRPVLTQQSMRELDLTDRTYADVLDAATWAVFQEGYKDGYGADGDHLKNMKDIRVALDLGFSMITLDCSEHIDDGVLELESAEVLARYNQLPSAKRQAFEPLYKAQSYELQSGTTVRMDAQNYERMVLTYHQALDFMEEVYEQVIAPLDRTIDFEISIDEVATPTTPQDHFFVASELQKRGIKACSVAPRFCGRFEKGVDYIGDLGQFEDDFAVHAQIASHFGYKISIHSGSDKFSVFPVIGKYAAAAGYHVKTAGTNWLEALRVIAKVDPRLFRKLHKKALESLQAARKYYNVSLDLAKIPEISSLEDQELPKLLDQNDPRQLLHITYGFMLRDPELKDDIYRVMQENEDGYREVLVKHIGRHLRTLGL